ncbi:MAG: class I SAM-dependent methyltransferase, partial [Armatimonadetes bacterium]|nr:class I SAM-dependent methyltransferase [Anaerolineae bacterium]
AGTGRLTRLLTPYAAKIYAFDISAHMLETAQGLLVPSVELAVGDNRHMPVRDHVAHITLAGWSFGHAVAWSPDAWRAEIGLMLAEMARITQPEGVQIIIETLGTGQAEPHAPNDQLATFYDWLEAEHGFTRTWLRTDYRFESVAQAEQLMRFFFNDALAEHVIQADALTLPECTGIWWRRG